MNGAVAFRDGAHTRVGSGRMLRYRRPAYGHDGEGTVRLIVSVVGYILVQRDVPVGPGETHTLTIPLAEGTGTYTETVTVTSDLFRPAQPGVAAQQVLGSADIQNLRGVLADDPLRAVQVLPGVATGDATQARFMLVWLKRFVDNDARYEQFLCPNPSGTAISEYRSTCPYGGGTTPTTNPGGTTTTTAPPPSCYWWQWWCWLGF